MGGYNTICTWCGTPFKRCYGSERQCSFACKASANNVSVKISVKTKSCVPGFGYCRWCKDKFEKKAVTHLYCSIPCQENSRAIENVHHRFDIFYRDNFTCLYCNKNLFKDNIKLVVDHVYPVSKGGSSEFLNLVTACEECNHSKNARVLPIDTLMGIWDKTSNPDYKMTYPEAIEYWRKNKEYRLNRLKKINK